MNNKKYTIGIVGLGPIGMILAHHFQKAGCEIAICDVVKEKVDLIKTQGIKLSGSIKQQSQFSNVFSSLEEMLDFKVDVLLCAIKVYQVKSILKIVKDHKNFKDLAVISAQNGIETENEYKDLFDDSQIYRLIVNFAGTIDAPNAVNVTFFNPPNFIASIDDSGEKLSTWIADQLSSSGLTTKSVDSFLLENKIWRKTILNAALSSLCAISKFTMKDAMDSAYTQELVEHLIREGVEVANAEGIKFEDNFTKLCLRYLKNAGSHYPSLAVDLMNNRETEVDYINGKIVSYGRKHYIKTPFNLTFTNLVHAISQKNLKNTQK